MQNKGEAGMGSRDIRGRWKWIRAQLIHTTAWLIVLVGAWLIANEKDVACIFFAFAPLVLALIGLLGWMLALWADAPEEQVAQSVVEAARNKYTPGEPEQVNRTTEGFKQANDGLQE
jgi:hypothetical protein